MTTVLMPILNEASWLDKRKGYITSTSLASLFNLQPASHSTFFELYHITRGNIPAVNVDSNFTRFGKLIEQSICEMINVEHKDWKIEPFNYFAYDDEDKMGSSFDRQVSIDGKKYLLELKSTSYGEYKRKFVEHSEDDIEASPHYECQMQGELEMVKGHGFHGIIMAVFILDTRQLKYIFRTYDLEMGAALRQAVRNFWAMTTPPTPDYALDKSLIAKLCPALEADKQLDATQNNLITSLCAQYRNSKDIIKQEEKAADEAYGQLLEAVGDARYVWTNGHKISVSDIKASPQKYITEDMVGKPFGRATEKSKRLTIKSLAGADDEE